MNSKTFLRFSGSHGSGNLKKEAEIFLWKKIEQIFSCKMYFRHGAFCKEAVWNEGQTVIIKPPHDYYFFFFAQQNEKNVNK